MKKILYISHKPIFPIKDGGSRAMALFFEALTMCENLEITYVPLVTSKHAKVDPPRGSQPIQTVPLPVSTRKGLFQFRRMIDGVPLNVLRYLGSSSVSTINDLILQRNFDAIICDGFYALCLIGEEHFKHHAVIYRSHNLETYHWKQRSKYDIWWKRPLFRWIARTMKPFEQAKVERASKVLSISADEMDVLHQWNPNTHLFLPHITEHFPNHSSSMQQNSIGFVGDMEWLPNKRAMTQFIAKVWPVFHQEFPHVQLSIAGRGSEKYTNPSLGIQGYGFVGQLREFIQQQRFLINPILEGSGFNMKLLDALVYQVPLISYRSRLCGLTGIACFLPSMNDEEFLQNMKRMFADDAVIQEISATIHTDATKYFNLNDRVNELQNVLHGN